MLFLDTSRDPAIVELTSVYTCPWQYAKLCTRAVKMFLPRLLYFVRKLMLISCTKYTTTHMGKRQTKHVGHYWSLLSFCPRFINLFSTYRKSFVNFLVFASWQYSLQQHPHLYLQLDNLALKNIQSILLQARTCQEIYNKDGPGTYCVQGSLRVFTVILFKIDLLIMRLMKSECLARL